jgi:hypothetical protein
VRRGVFNGLGFFFCNGHAISSSHRLRQSHSYFYRFNLLYFTSLPVLESSRPFLSEGAHAFLLVLGRE